MNENEIAILAMKGLLSEAEKEHPGIPAVMEARMNELFIKCKDEHELMILRLHIGIKMIELAIEDSKS